jgi:hypothetical protein
MIDNTCSNAPKELNFTSYLLTEHIINGKYIDD